MSLNDLPSRQVSYDIMSQLPQIHELIEEEKEGVKADKASDAGAPRETWSVPDVIKPRAASIMNAHHAYNKVISHGDISFDLMSNIEHDRLQAPNNANASMVLSPTMRR